MTSGMRRFMRVHVSRIGALTLDERSRLVCCAVALGTDVGMQAHGLQTETPMNEQPDHPKRSTKEMKAESKRDGGRERRAMSERCDAVKRWIDDGDEPAVRGID